MTSRSRYDEMGAALMLLASPTAVALGHLTLVGFEACQKHGWAAAPWLCTGSAAAIAVAYGTALRICAKERLTLGGLVLILNAVAAALALLSRLLPGLHDFGM